jgi:hypothetical protein
MPTLADLSRLDLTEIKRRALAAGAAALAEAARRRAGAAPGAITHAVTDDDRAMVRVIDPGLVRRERGDVGRAPEPFLAPDAADRIAVRAAIAESLRKDLP